jgi:hypothetical protein
MYSSQAMVKGMAQGSENRKAAITACILIGIFLVAVFAAALAPRTSQTTKTDDPQTQALKETYRAMFGSKPVNASDYSAFNTPVPMYLAAIIGLKHGGWNASRLQNMTVYASLAYCRFASGNSSLGYWTSFENLHSVTEPVDDYWPGASEDSPGDGATYRYLWVISVAKPNPVVPTIPPPGLYYVDAATAELVTLPGAY